MRPLFPCPAPPAPAPLSPTVSPLLTGLVEAHNFVLDTGAARGGHDLHVEVLAKLLANGGRLQRKLSRRHQNQRLDVVLRRVHLLQRGNEVRARFAGAWWKEPRRR